MSVAAFASRLTQRLVRLGLAKPRAVISGVVIGTLLLGALIVRVEVDTDPENMLPGDHPVRELNAEIRATFGGNDVVVAGLTSSEALGSDELDAVSDLHAVLVDDADVMGPEVVSLASVLDRPGDPVGSVGLVAQQIAANPLLAGLVLTDDGRTAAVFVPLVDKGAASEVTSRIEDVVAADPRVGDVELHVAGLPLAQDAFGSQMFLQMGLFAPLAGALVFAAMWLFFRRLSLVVPAMVVAMLTVIATMGLLIGTGNTVHIMSSMIAIFLMPTAILDSVHVLSEFFDRYPATRDRRQTIEEIYHELAGPLLFTTLTTMVGFASLALAPIPPVRVFGIFVAIGMGLAWLFTVLFVPAYLMALDGEKLDRKLAARDVDGRLAHFVRAIGRLPLRRPVVVLVVLTVLLGVVAIPAIPRIEVNDNPVRWFKSDHEVRVATEALNAALPGTFGANIVLRADDPTDLTSAETLAAIDGLEAAWAATSQVGSAATVVDLTQGLEGLPAAEALSTARAESALVGSLVTADQRSMNLRLLLNDGDNQSMQAVIDATEAQLEERPFPASVSWQWGGETYLNLVWQNEMVDGMLTAFISTLGIVLLLLVVLFRSLRWALLAMLPVVWTVLLVYGVLGWIGKDYDMPIAVLSTLVIGIGIDFAIHFVERQREERESQPDHHTALVAFFEEPARALTRNAAIVAIGFTPLLLSSLTPYIVVGIFLSSILTVSWLATVVGLPAFLRVGEIIEQRMAERRG